MAADKKLFEQPTHDVGTGIPTLPAEAKRLAYEEVGQQGAINSPLFEMKGIFLAQGEDQDSSQKLEITANADVYVLKGTSQVALIDKSKLLPGGYLSILAESAGLTFLHDFDKASLQPPPANIDDLTPIFMSTGEAYTTSKNDEPFDFRLILKSSGNFEFHDWTRGSNAGSVTPDFYVAEKAQSQGITVQVGTQLLGFEDGQLASYTLYGTAQAATVNAEGNILTFTGAGVLTGMITGTEAISFATGADFGLTAEGGIYQVVNAVDFVGVADNALYLEHTNGAVDADGVTVLNTAAKVAQIFV